MTELWTTKGVARNRDVTPRFPKYIVAGTRRESATHIRKENIPCIRVKPHYMKINTKYTI